MSIPGTGTRLPLSAGRKLVVEMLEHARRVPTIPVARAMDLSATAAARGSAMPAPSWTAIFIRAYGLVCQQHHELRRALIPWPWLHLYEHPFSIGSIVVEREYQGELALLAAKIRRPESMPLIDIDRRLGRLKHTPVREISEFRQMLRLARLPRFLLRFTFWQTLYLSGQTRAKRFGTFLVSSYGNLGAEQLHPLGPLTTLLTFGPIAANGDVVVKIIYDHRVLDGRYVARALAELERTLNGEIVTELSALRRQAA